MSDISDTSLYVVAGSLLVPKAIELVTSFFKGSVKRNIDTADKEDEKRDKKLEDVEKKLTDHELKLRELDTSHVNHKDSIAKELGNIIGQLTRLDVRVAESNKESERRFKEMLSDAVIDLNRKLTTLLTSEIPNIVRDQLKDAKRRR